MKHTLDIRKAIIKGEPMDEYKGGWLDKCEGLVLAVAAILIEFVEKERGGPEDLQKRIDETIEYMNSSDFVDDPEHLNRSCYYDCIARDQKILYLYTWWTKDRLELIRREEQLLKEWADSTGMHKPNADLDKVLNRKRSKKSDALQKAHWDAQARLRWETQNFLHGVIDIRESLWT